MIKERGFSSQFVLKPLFPVLIYKNVEILTIDYSLKVYFYIKNSFYRISSK